MDRIEKDSTEEDSRREDSREDKIEKVKGVCWHLIKSLELVIFLSAFP